jgi:hypothetical protein
MSEGYYAGYRAQCPKRNDTFVDYGGKVWIVVNADGNTLTDGHNAREAKQVATDNGPLYKTEL